MMAQEMTQGAGIAVLSMDIITTMDAIVNIAPYAAGNCFPAAVKLCTRHKRKRGEVRIEQIEKDKAPIILDFSGNEQEALRKLESILYTSGWNHYVFIDPDTPSEDRLLFSLIREGAVGGFISKEII
jgi:hypothetical protein